MEEQLTQMKFRFFTNISHELRTPLTLIITPLSSLLTDIQDSKLKQQLSSIYRNAQELLQLVNQLLDFRKLEVHGEKLQLMNGESTNLSHQLVKYLERMPPINKLNTLSYCHDKGYICILTGIRCIVSSTTY